MSLEYFKKQVLLLHSEQSTLDDLSSGFNDRYTVHCATSGTEALDTLGATQIDVIVSAQELPGMSGLDALREAKKRSPETIGILLAGNEDDGLEALVGDKEVFQIVRGSVTPDSLKSLIDNATRQARLMALAESANDTAANVDEPVTEHIVMETSEHGATIISDGTGQVPILDPMKVSSAPEVGAQAVDVLVLTQDEEFLVTVKESTRGLHNIIFANTLAQADDAVRNGKVGVAVIDAAMVGSNAEKLTMHLRTISPRLVSIVAGRRDDGEMLMDLINRGKVYRFLLKPVSPGRSRLAIEASVKHHLEAPDSAFKIVGKAGPLPKAEPKAQPKPQPKTEAKPQPKTEPKPQPKTEAKPQPKTAPKPQPEAESKPQAKPQAQAAAKPDKQPNPQAVTQKPATTPKAPKPEPQEPTTEIAASSTIVPDRGEALSPIDDGLDMFGGEDSSFTETMTGMVKSVGDSFSKMRKSAAEKTEAPAAADSGGSLLGDPKLLGIGAVALVAIIGLSFWMFSGSDEPVVTDDPVASSPAITEAEPAFETETVIPSTPGLDDLIDEAQLAAAAGQVFNPPGSNAIELYLAALEVSPGDPVAEAGLEEVITQALGMAESALLDRRPADVAAALQRVGSADPDNARLPFLNAQLEQLQLRNYLDNARVAIRDSRFQDASVAIASARSLAVADATEIDVIEGELSAALSDQRAGEILAQATTRLEEGKLIAPSSDNARYYYELALSNDPGNSAAEQGLKVVASRLVLQAREQIDAGNYPAAEALLADARGIDPSSSDLAASTAALGAARDRQAQQLLDAERRAAAEKATAERIAAEKAAAERAAAEKAVADRIAAEEAAAKKAAAEQAAAERIAAEKAAAERAAAEKAAAERVAAGIAAVKPLGVEQSAAKPATVSAPPRQQQAAADSAPAPQSNSTVAATQPAIAEPTRDDARSGNSEMQLAAADPAQQPQAVPPPMSAAPVSVSSLQRTKYVAPKYPRTAQRRSLSGWVDVAFTVDIDGTVTDVTVRDSNPGETFVNAAVTAVEGWEFEPVIMDGVAVQKRAAVRMMFAIE